MQQLRKEYKRLSLSEHNVLPDPFAQFDIWFIEALNSGIEEPNAMALATVSPEGMPSARMVLLKEVEKDGFVFFTNYQSRKGRHLEKNQNAALLFFWDKLERQVRIEGLVLKTDAQYSDDYFQSRTRESKAGAIASKQSTVIGSKEALENEFLKILGSESKTTLRPEYWGGYKLMPVLFEFWQGREHRLHDRIQYRSESGRWITERLAP